jgi:putative ABC transport system permease protein
VKAKAGTDISQLAEQIRQRLPDLDVYTANEFGTLSQNYWMNRTSIGVGFGASTLLGLVVGLVIVGQSLYALALDHLSDYATLRAMGAKDSSLSGIILLQASTVAFLGTAIGMGVVLAIRQTWNVPLAPLEIPWELMAASIALVFGICYFGATLPLGRVRKVDPMMVLQG